MSFCLGCRRALAPGTTCAHCAEVQAEMAAFRRAYDCEGKPPEPAPPPDPAAELELLREAVAALGRLVGEFDAHFGALAKHVPGREEADRLLELARGTRG